MPFWSYIGAKRQDNSGVSPFLKQGVLHMDNLSKAKILNDQFRSVFTREDTTNIPHPHNPAYKEIPDLHISQEGVEKLLRNVKASKASGPDWVPYRFLTELAPELAPILIKICKQLLRDGVLPSDWKNVDVAPSSKGSQTSSGELPPPSFLNIDPPGPPFVQRQKCPNWHGHIRFFLSLWYRTVQTLVGETEPLQDKWSDFPPGRGLPWGQGAGGGGRGATLPVREDIVWGPAGDCFGTTIVHHSHKWLTVRCPFTSLFVCIVSFLVP